MTPDLLSTEPSVAIRERGDLWPEGLPKRVAPNGVPRYIVHNPQNGNVYTVFGMVQGGDTREEAVFWAERFASKNDLTFVRPEGWENVEARLPEQADA